MVEQFDRLDDCVGILYLGELLPEFVVSLEGAVVWEHIADDDLAVDVLADEMVDDAIGDPRAGSYYKQTHVYGYI